ncbi:hypothetical protein [Francisella marina]|uniref:hypothetical protein n=1 Tax=Francisella marina TaxID=2249302 RepID=UPI0011ED43AA|nr:hypothetical protein [Francisella marina]QEO58337.1 hypothetical protein F0R75_00570 [Francisella marina]
MATNFHTVNSNTFQQVDLASMGISDGDVFSIQNPSERPIVFFSGSSLPTETKGRIIYPHEDRGYVKVAGENLYVKKFQSIDPNTIINFEV